MFSKRVIINLNFLANLSNFVYCHLRSPQYITLLIRYLKDLG